jgi:thioester reductase-like protein
MAHTERLALHESSLRTIEIPEVQYFLESHASTKPYTSSRYCDEDQVVTFFHSSGTTGNPKVIPISHGYIKAAMQHASLPAPIGVVTSGAAATHSGTIIAFLPYFHLAGFLIFVFRITGKSTIILYPVRPLTVDTVVDMVRKFRPETLLVTPAHLEEVWKMGEAAMSLFTSPRFVFSSAGPLAKSAGDALVRAGVKITNLLGSTETGVMAALLHPPELKLEWQWMAWHPDRGAHMELRELGIYELTTRRSPDRKYQCEFFVYPDRDVFHTGDMFEQHPAYPTLWRYLGRKDDMMVLSNGENFTPVTLEKALDEHPLVSGALATGQGKFQVGLLIEPNWPAIPQDLLDAGADSLLDALWPAIVKANQTSPTHAQVWRSKVILTSRDKPFFRSPKGTAVRRRTLDNYAREIEAMYSDERPLDYINTEVLSSPSALRDYILRLLIKTDGGLADLSDEEDFLTRGVDSLQILAVASQLSQLVQLHTGTNDRVINSRDIYNNSSIRALVWAVQANLDSEIGMNVRNNSRKATQKEAIDGLVAKYTSGLPPSRQIPVNRSAQLHSHVVILTGATGFLGTYLLAKLRSDPTVSHIFCLVRSKAAERALHQTVEKTTVAVGPARVDILLSDLSDVHFGLSDTLFESLRQAATSIVHVAWEVNFNKPLLTFESNIKGVRNLIDFCGTGDCSPRFTFVSSIGTVMNWGISGYEGPVPEELLNDLSIVPDQGYAESKHVAERIIEAAAKFSHVNCTVLRLGQVTSPTRAPGLWTNENEWFPSLLRTSLEIGFLPDTLLRGENEIDWIPVDEAAGAITDIALSSCVEQCPGVFNIANPNKTSWLDLARSLCNAVESGAASKRLEIVPFAAWIARLKEQPLTPENAQKLPALKLLDVFDEPITGSATGVRLSTAKACHISPTMRALQPIGEAMMHDWLKQWVPEKNSDSGLL